MQVYLKCLKLGALALLSSVYMGEGAIAGDYGSPDSNSGGGDQQQGQQGQPGYPPSGNPGYPPPGGGVPAPSGDSGAAALFGAIGQLGTTALTTNAQTQQLGISTQATTTQAQNLEQTQLGLQRNAIQGGLQQQAMNNQANMAGSGVVGGYGVPAGSGYGVGGYRPPVNVSPPIGEEYGNQYGEQENYGVGHTPHSAEYREQKRMAEFHERQLEAIKQQNRALKKKAELQAATQHPTHQPSHPTHGQASMHEPHGQAHEPPHTAHEQAPMHEPHGQMAHGPSHTAHEPAPMHKVEPSKPLSEGAKRQEEQKAAADARKQKRKEAKAKKIQQQKAQQGEKKREREEARATKEQQRAVAG